MSKNLRTSNFETDFVVIVEQQKILIFFFNDTFALILIHSLFSAFLSLSLGNSLCFFSLSHTHTFSLTLSGFLLLPYESTLAQVCAQLVVLYFALGKLSECGAGSFERISC